MIVDGKHHGLTEEQLSRRRLSIGGSDANYIMAGGEKLWNLWEFKVGKREREDLSGILAVQMGTFTEPFNATWFERQTGMPVGCRGISVVHPDRPYMTATLDGVYEDIVRGIEGIWEAKHVGGREDRQTVLSRYQPQLHHNMYAAPKTHAILSVFVGNSGYWYEEVECDPIYLDELLDREAQFWGWVQGNTPPPDMPAVAAPVAAVRSVDMTGSNSWAANANTWVANKTAAKVFKTAEDGLKESMPADAADAWGHGVRIKRAKNGSLRISNMETT